MMQAFDKKAALELLDNEEELLQVLADAFLNESKFEKPVLEKLISEKKFLEAASYVHAVKGAARQLCMEKLQHSAQKTEDFLRGKSEGDINLLINQIFLDYQEAVQELKNSLP